MADLFSDIEIEAVLINDIAYPMLHVLDMRKAADVKPEDHFILEKYKLDRSDTDLMTALSNVLTNQFVLVYMGTKVYMSASLYMADEDVDLDDYAAFEQMIGGATAECRMQSGP